MSATAFDSFYLRDRYGSPAMRAIWDDRAMIQRWLDVEAALAATQAELGLVPAAAAREIARRARASSVSTSRAMKREFDRTWNPVMPLVNALRASRAARRGALACTGAPPARTSSTPPLALQIRDTYAVVLAELDAHRGRAGAARPAATATP